MFYIILTILLVVSIIMLIKMGLLKKILKQILNVNSHIFRNYKKKYIEPIFIISTIIYFVGIPLFFYFYYENYSLRYGDAPDNPRPGEDSIISVPIGTDTEGNDIIYNINLTDKTLNAIGNRERYNNLREILINTIQIFTQHMPVRIKKKIAYPRVGERGVKRNYTSQIINCNRGFWKSDKYDYEVVSSCPAPSGGGIYCHGANLTRTCLFTLYPYEISGRNPIPLLEVGGTGVGERGMGGSVFVHELGHQVMRNGALADIPYDKDDYEYRLKAPDIEETKILNFKTILYALTFARFNSPNLEDVCPEIELPYDESIDITSGFSALNTDYTCKWGEFWAELTAYWFNLQGGQDRGERSLDELGFGNLFSREQALTDIKTINDLKDIKINTILLDSNDDNIVMNPSDDLQGGVEYFIEAGLARPGEETTYNPVSISIYDFMYYIYGPPAVEDERSDMCKEIIEKYTPNLRYTCTGKWNESKTSIIGIITVIYFMILLLILISALLYKVNLKINTNPQNPQNP